MTITLTYDPTLSRVRVQMTGLSVPAPVSVERSTDQVRWTTVRGAAAVPLSGGAARVDDYEFAADVVNYYRVTGPSRYDLFGRVTANGWGTATSGHAWSATGGTAANFATTGSVGQHIHSTTNAPRRTVITGTSRDADVVRDVSTSAAITGAALSTGTLLRYTSTTSYYWARVEFNAGSTTVTAKISRVLAGVLTDLAAANPVPDLTYSPGAALRSRARIVGNRLYMRVWAAGQTEPEAWTLTAVDTTIPAGGQAGEQSWLLSGNTNTLPVTVTYDNWAQTLPAAVLESASITPVLDGVWLKSIGRPFLNRQVTVTDWTDTTRPARTGVFPILGRSIPVAVNELRGSRRWQIEVLTATVEQAAAVDMLLASGDPLLVHVPAGFPAAGGYVTVGDSTETHPTRGSAERLFGLPLTEVAAPAPDIVGSTSNWQTVVNTYPTWQDVINAHPTWADLLDLVGDPTDIIV